MLERGISKRLGDYNPHRRPEVASHLLKSHSSILKTAVARSLFVLGISECPIRAWFGVDPKIGPSRLWYSHLKWIFGLFNEELTLDMARYSEQHGATAVSIVHIPDKDDD